VSTVPRKSDKADLSRIRILDAAAKLFSTEGYAAISLRAIAAAAGMKAGSVYYHFGSKQEIVIEILDLGIAMVHEEVHQTVDALPTTASPDAIIRAGILAHLRAVFEFSDYTSANVRIYGQVPEPIRSANLKVRHDYEALWDDTLKGLAARDGLRDGVDVKAFRLMLIGALNATIEWFDPERGDLAGLADKYADIMLHGLLPQAE
jgi:TetR/AcrR family transcriptional regulator, cholesterol catabolism regulator